MGLALLPVLAHAPALATGIQRFGTWTAACDNLANCRAIGLPRQPVAPRFGFLIIERRGDTRGDMLLAWGADSGAFTELFVDGERAVHFDLSLLRDLAPRDHDSEPRHVLADPATIRRFIARAVGGTFIALDPNAERDNQVPADGMKAALAWIDEQQGRAGSRDGLVRRGDRRATPEAKRAPVIRPSPGEPRAEMPRAAAAAALAFYRGTDCERADAAVVEDIWGRSIDGRHWLVEAPCRHGGQVGVLFIVVTGGAQAVAGRPVFEVLERNSGRLLAGPEHAPRRGGHGVGHGTVEAITSDAAGCRESASWQWDGTAFRLASLVIQPVCMRGLGIWQDFPLWRTRER